MAHVILIRGSYSHAYQRHTKGALPPLTLTAQIEDDKNKGSYFYFNQKTGETTWEQPHNLAWEEHRQEF